MEEKKFDWREFLITRTVDFSLSTISTIAALEIYSHRDKFDELVGRAKSFGRKYDFPIDDMVDRIYAKINERLSAELPKQIEESIKKYKAGP